MLWLEAGTGWLGGCCTFVRMILWAVGKNEWLFTSLEKEISTSYALTTRKPTSSWGTGQVGAEGRGDYEARSGVWGLAPTSLGVFE